jgi:PDZ domain-containing secreted protein
MDLQAVDMPSATNETPVVVSSTELPLGASARDERLSRLRRVRRRVAASTLVVAMLSAAATSPYIRTAPGPLMAVTVPDAPAFVGRYSYPTVDVDRLRWWQYVTHSVSGDGEISRAAADDTGDDAAMRQAKRVAWDLAATATGENACGAVTVEEFMDGSPAEAAGVRLDDEIVAVNGAPLRCTSELIAVVRLSGGEPLDLNVRRGNTTLTVTVTPKFIDDRWRLGVATWAHQDPWYDIDTAAVGGSSAGLILTLAYIDSLQTGDLTGGRHISGSATISVDGTAGPVGGLNHKLAAAENDRVDVFFVSSSQSAKIVSDTVQIVEVSSVWDALEWLCSDSGGTSQEVCSHW